MSSIRTLTYLARAKLLFGGLLAMAAMIFADFAGAGVLRKFAEYGLPEPTLNSICQSMLVSTYPDQAKAIEILSAHRARRLKIPTAESRVAKRLLVDNQDSSLYPRLAGHLRGIETWAVKSSDGGGPKMAAGILVGSDAIERYYKNLKTFRDRVEEFVRFDPHHQALSAAYNVNMVGIMAPALLATAAWIDLPSAAVVPLSVFALYFLRNTYSANRFRFVRDTDSSNFDARLTAYLQRDEAEQRTTWEFGSRTYRLPAKLVDGIWNKDRNELSDAIRHHVIRQIFPSVDRQAIGIAWIRFGMETVREVRRLTKSVYVIVDRLVDFDEVAGRLA